MAAQAALMILPSVFGQFGAGPAPTNGPVPDSTPPSNDDVPDVGAAQAAVMRQQQADQIAVNTLVGQYKTYNQKLADSVGKTQKDITGQLSKQQEAFQKTMVNVDDVVKAPGIDPDLLMYGGLAFGALALVIVFKPSK